MRTRRRRRLLSPLDIGTTAAHDRRAKERGRQSRLFEVEDLLLVAWVAGLDYLVRRALGRPEALLAQVDGLTHWAVLLVGSAWLFLIFTRGQQDDDLDHALMRRLLMVGPAYPVLSVYGLIASSLHERWYGPQPRSAGGEPPWPAPAVSPLWRRTAALPVIIIGDALFTGGFAATPIGRGFEMTFMGTYFLVVTAAIYVFTVVGPRIVAGATVSPLLWIARFVVFLAASWFGGSTPVANP